MALKFQYHSKSSFIFLENNDSLIKIVSFFGNNFMVLIKNSFIFWENSVANKGKKSIFLKK